VCVCELERETKKEKEGAREEDYGMCSFMCLSKRETERERRERGGREIN